MEEPRKATNPWMLSRVAHNVLSIAIFLCIVILCHASASASESQPSAVPSELTQMPTKCESCMLFSRELDNAVARLPPRMVCVGDLSAFLKPRLSRIVHLISTVSFSARMRRKHGSSMSWSASATACWSTAFTRRRTAWRGSRRSSAAP